MSATMNADARVTRKPLLAAAGIGVAMGVLTYLAGPWFAAVAGGIGGFATTVMVQVGLWLRRSLATLQSVEA